MEALEERRHLAATMLTNGVGAGTLQVLVDAYGAYGSASAGGDALFDTGAPGGSTGTTYHSALFFGPYGDFLAEGAPAARPLPSVAFKTVSASSAESQFTVADFDVTLTQTLQTLTPGVSVLVQTYVFTNNTGLAKTFDVVRHVDGDIYMTGGMGNDFGGASADGRFVFLYDTPGGPDTPAVYFGITSGGDVTPVGYAVREYPYHSVLVISSGIPVAHRNTIEGDADGDRLTDAGYDATISLQDRLSVPAGESVTYVTRTYFGLAAARDLVNPGNLEYSSATYEVDEDAGQAVITVSRTGGLVGDVTVEYSVSAGTATAGEDFTPVSGTLTFPHGVTSQTFTVPILDDVLAEGNETVQLALNNPGGGATLGALAGAELVILENDQPGQFRFSAAEYTVNESGATITLTVERYNGNLGQVSVDYATSDLTAVAGADYTPVSGTLVFDDGVRSQTITIPILNDALAEGDEAFAVTLSNPQGGAGVVSPEVAVVTIADDESGIGFDRATYAVHEDAGIAAITVARFGDVSSPATVDYSIVDDTATAGLDYEMVSGTLSFTAGQREAVIVVPILDDWEYEPIELATLILSNPSAGHALGGANGDYFATAELEIHNIDRRPLTVSDIRLIPARQGISGIVITYSQPVVHTAPDLFPLRYTIFAPGRRALTHVPILSESFDPATNSVTLLTRRPMRNGMMYQLRINAQGLTDIHGNLLDGDGDGIGGDAFTGYFARGRRLNYVDSDGDTVRLTLNRGMMELVRWNNGDARSLRLTDTVFSRSRLTGRVVWNRRAGGDGVTQIDELLGAEDIQVLLPETILIGQQTV